MRQQTGDGTPALAQRAAVRGLRGATIGLHCLRFQAWEETEMWAFRPRFRPLAVRQATVTKVTVTFLGGGVARGREGEGGGGGGGAVAGGEGVRVRGEGKVGEGGGPGRQVVGVVRLLLRIFRRE